jgi:hypothetical protein
VGRLGENNKIELRKDDASRRRAQIQRTNKFKSILVLFSETFRKGRFRLFPFSTSTTRSQVHSETIVLGRNNIAFDFYRYETLIDQ